MMNIIIPGSFSPLTAAHIENVEAALDYAINVLGINESNIKVIIVPASRFYKKGSVYRSDMSQSVDMAYLSESLRIKIIENGLHFVKKRYQNVNYIVSTTEIDMANSSETNSVPGTGALLNELRNNNTISLNRDENLLLLGKDNILTLPWWSNPMQMIDISNIGILSRGDVSSSIDFPSSSKAYYNDDKNNIHSGTVCSKEQILISRPSIIQNIMSMPLINKTHNNDFSSSLLRKYIRFVGLNGDELTSSEIKELLYSIDLYAPELSVRLNLFRFLQEDRESLKIDIVRVLVDNVSEITEWLTYISYSELLEAYSICDK
jgi:nicotinic acid mononucleotide adenylyltransferase